MYVFRRVNAVFSTATFHWIAGHRRLFDRLYDLLEPGGKLVAQAGAEGQLAYERASIRRVSSSNPFAQYFGGWREPWTFPSVPETEGNLWAAGFEQINCWLEEHEIVPDNLSEYLQTVILGDHLVRLPQKLHSQYVNQIEAQLNSSALNYVRINIEAGRPG